MAEDTTVLDSDKRHNTTQEKNKIRARYQKKDNLEVIPATPAESFHNDKSEKRVAIYVRVSTDDPRQTSSYELQKNYYMDAVKRHPNWRLVDIYADEGISGTSLRRRDAFIKMISDCKEGKIDLIVTKSVSRFSRNIVDCIGYVRELKALRPPVAVFFETENIYTLDPDSEMSLSFVSTLVQEESHNKSKSMNQSVEMRFKGGIFLTPVLLGYDHDDDGNLVVNKNEAETVRLIFFMYLYGFTCRQIAEDMSLLGRKTKKGNLKWSSGSILQILQNERHCGDVLARKTWTPNYLDHKSKKNRKDRNQYLGYDHHESIISRDDFIAVQRLISNAKYGHKGFLPELKVITEGALKGFVSINPRWAGFSASDYIRASRSVCALNAVRPDECFKVEVQRGDFDLRGYEIARSQFFDVAKKASITFTINELKFGIECIRKMNDIAFVELLIHPDNHLLAVRPSTDKNRNAVRWAMLKETACQTRTISGTAFLKTIYEVYGWRAEFKYRMRGIQNQKKNESVYIFDMRETEIFVPVDLLSLENGDEAFKDKNQMYFGKPLISTAKAVCAYPAEWAKTFGSDYYRHTQAQKMLSFSKTGEWKTTSEGKAFNESPLKVTSEKEIELYVAQIKENIKQKGG
ncbi:recombinase family protein [Deltaproteobacteria bacterium Smac51]|nr:recombinase family protein [Deltaproteobacteria bacterium Smac51]